MRDKLKFEIEEMLESAENRHTRYAHHLSDLLIDQKEKNLWDALGKLSANIDILRRDLDALVDHLGLERVVTMPKFEMSKTTYVKRAGAHKK